MPSSTKLRPRILSLALLAAVAITLAAGRVGAGAQTPTVSPTVTATRNSDVPASVTITPGSISPVATATVLAATPRPAVCATPGPGTGGRPGGNPQLPSIEITPADDGTTIHVALGQTVVIRMGTDLDWSVSYDPPGVLVAVPGVNALVRGVQGILRGQQAGTTQVKAEGKAHCDPGQACPQFIRLVSVTVVVVGAGTGGVVTQQPAATGGTGTTIAPRPPQGVSLPNTGTGTARDASSAWGMTAVGVLLLCLALGGAGLLGRR